MYIECISNLVVEIDKDKKYLSEDCFTLADLVEAVLMRFNKGKNSSNKMNSTMKKSIQKQTLADDLIT